MANYYFNPGDYATGTDLTTIGWTKRHVINADTWTIAEPSAGLKVLRFTQAANSTARASLSWDAIDADAGRADVELLAVFRAPNADSYDVDCRVFARGSGSAGSETFAYAGFQIDTQLERAVGECSAGTLTASSTTAISGSSDYRTSGAWLAQRSRINGATASIKYWLPADPDDPTADEPEEWLYTTSGLTVSAAGWAGINRGLSGSSEWRRLAIATGGDTATFSAPSSTPVAFSGSVANQTGTEGVAFSLNLSTYFSGTETPFAYSVQSGTLPAGLSLNSSTGVISGTPTTAGVSSGIVIRATDATPDTADSNAFTITINATNTSPSFTGPNIADISGTEGVALTSVDVSPRFFDSESGLTFSAVGSWPAGVTVSSAGVISGTPTTAGTYSGLQVRATDAGGLTADSNAFTITVAAPLAAGINVTEPLKNNTGALLASLSGVRVAVLQAADLVSVYETSGLTTNASGILGTISDAGIVAGQQYHVAIKLADGGVGITGPITAS